MKTKLQLIKKTTVLSKSVLFEKSSLLGSVLGFEKMTLKGNPDMEAINQIVNCWNSTSKSSGKGYLIEFVEVVSEATMTELVRDDLPIESKPSAPLNLHHILSSIEDQLATAKSIQEKRPVSDRHAEVEWLKK